jgi:hypothetical protein
MFEPFLLPLLISILTVKRNGKITDSVTTSDSSRYYKAELSI